MRLWSAKTGHSSRTGHFLTRQGRDGPVNVVVVECLVGLGTPVTLPRSGPTPVPRGVPREVYAEDRLRPAGGLRGAPGAACTGRTRRAEREERDGQLSGRTGNGISPCTTEAAGEDILMSTQKHSFGSRRRVMFVFLCVVESRIIVISGIASRHFF